MPKLINEGIFRLVNNLPLDLFFFAPLRLCGFARAYLSCMGLTPLTAGPV